MAAISIHALLAESDARLAAFAQHGAEDFYPRSPCGERRYSLRPPPARGEISIHALLAESDHARVGVAAGAVISIHALLAESDNNSDASVFNVNLFLSTLSLRRATNSLVRCSCTIDISIHALLAESDNFLTARFTHREISIHALLAESDAWPVGISHHRRISIHALLAESDTSPAAAPFRLSTFLSTLSLRRATAQAWPVLPAGCHFYPRSPCGERPLCPKTQPSKPTFLSTLSLRRATLYKGDVCG